MPFNTTTRRCVAIIGGGISGMAAAWRLKKSHRVTLFEAELRLSGHARTIMGGKRGDQRVDIGFIVFNRVNYLIFVNCSTNWTYRSPSAT